MPKLLIVDDDEFIRSGLKYLIDWEELGIEIVGEAENGRKGFELFLDKVPQIVLTDIRMPDGDGLEFIANIRKKDWDTHIVVLSGYDDFSYVRQAMHYQVEDYLLKPVDASELKEIMKSCCEDLEHRWLQEQLRKESFQLLRHNVFIRWVENRIDYEQLREKLDFLGESVIGYNRMFQAAVISWQDRHEGELPAAERKFRSFAILNTLEEVMEQQQKGVAFLNSDNLITCIFSGQAEDPERFAKANRNWMSEQASRLSSLLKTPWYCTLGMPVKQAGLLHHSYRDALRLQDVIDLTGPAKCVDRHEVTEHLASPVPDFLKRDALTPDILNVQNDDWKQVLERDFAWVIRQADPAAAARYVGAEWIATIKDLMRRLNVEGDAEIIDTNHLTQLFSQSNASQIKQMIMDTLRKLRDHVQKKSSRKKHTLIQQVEAYLHESFHEEQSLKTLAQKFNVSSIYLGRLFKAETGQYFSDYVNQLRLDEAKRLLRETHMRASDIAGKVGFLDPNYFFRKFKQTLGISPTEYRNLNQ